MDQKEKTDIKSLNLKELTVFMEQLGEKAFRAKQIYQWLHGKQAASFEEMTNIPKALIEKLKENSHLVSIKQEVLFRLNRNWKQNAGIMAALYGFGVVWGVIIELLGIVF